MDLVKLERVPQKMVVDLKLKGEQELTMSWKEEVSFWQENSISWTLWQEEFEYIKEWNEGQYY